MLAWCIPITRLTTSLVLLAAALVLLGGLVWQWRRSRPTARRIWSGRTAGYALLPLAVLTVAVLILRFIAVNHLLVPNWGDSLHHTLITQLFLEQRGVPRGYAPYAPVYSFTYHFGFHGLAALWAWMSQQTAWSAVISVGQILNALTVPAAYVLTRELFRSRAAALASAVVVGFLSGMPTQSCELGPLYPTGRPGAAALRAGLVPALDGRAAQPRSLGGLPRLALAVLGAAGLGLTHDRILIFYALFVLAYVLVMGWGIVRTGNGPARGAGLLGLLGRVLAVAVPGGLLFAPWLGNLLADYLPGLFNRLGRVTSTYIEDYSGWAFLTAYIGWVLPLLAVVGVLACHRRPAAHPAHGAAHGALDRAAGRGVAARRAGPAGRGRARHLYDRHRPVPAPGHPGRTGAGAPAAGRPAPAAPRAALVPGRLAHRRGRVGAAGRPGAHARQSRRTHDRPASAYVTPDDVRVINWITADTPSGARFLISAKSSYQGRAITAQDARHVAAVAGRAGPQRQRAAALHRLGRPASGRLRAANPGALPGQPDAHRAGQRRPAAARAHRLRVHRRADADHLCNAVAERHGGLLPAGASGRQRRLSGEAGRRALPAPGHGAGARATSA